jgi:L-malate glycosyltransferase
VADDIARGEGSPNPVRIMHVVVAGEIGGAERLLLDLASRPGATSAEHQIALFTPNRALASVLVGAGLRVHDRGQVRENMVAYLARSLGDDDVAWLTARIVEEGTDVVHTHTFGSHVLGTRAARRAKRPQLRTEHHVMHYFDPSAAPFTRWAAARTERFVAVSEYVRRSLSKTVPRVVARMSVVRNGVDTDHWRPREPRGAPTSGPLRLGIVCRLARWKRVHLAIEAAALADAELVVIGDGEQRSRLEGLARARKARVLFLGHQLDPRPFVASCDAILSTAENEPLGLSVLESLAMGRPVIAVTGGGLPEIVQHGVTGMLVAEATPAALAAVVAELRGDRARLREMGARGRAFAVEHGAIARTCEGYAAAYRAAALAP